MDDLERLVTELAAGLRLVTGMLGLTVALLPEADRAVVLKALAALQTESGPGGDSERSEASARSSLEGSRALTVLIEQFAAEVAASRAGAGR